MYNEESRDKLLQIFLNSPFNALAVWHVARQTGKETHTHREWEKVEKSEGNVPHSGALSNKIVLNMQRNLNMRLTDTANMTRSCACVCGCAERAKRAYVTQYEIDPRNMSDMWSFKALSLCAHLSDEISNLNLCQFNPHRCCAICCCCAHMYTYVYMLNTFIPYITLGQQSSLTDPENKPTTSKWC